ncbi:unnamed protein product [Caenorhabditis angaria]|uniref:Uncharacterized protein n=1 Tax=Caenorhabditis angaria TaxID=860376 RepID=A0A9P1J6U4_9PELO|nr:unnamed protein product [Caenorhabditis angaria]
MSNDAEKAENESKNAPEPENPEAVPENREEEKEEAVNPTENQSASAEKGEEPKVPLNSPDAIAKSKNLQNLAVVAPFVTDNVSEVQNNEPEAPMEVEENVENSLDGPFSPTNSTDNEAEIPVQQEDVEDVAEAPEVEVEHELPPTYSEYLENENRQRAENLLQNPPNNDNSSFDRQFRPMPLPDDRQNHQYYEGIHFADPFVMSNPNPGMPFPNPSGEGSSGAHRVTLQENGTTVNQSNLNPPNPNPIPTPNPNTHLEYEQRPIASPRMENYIAQFSPNSKNVAYQVFGVRPRNPPVQVERPLYHLRHSENRAQANQANQANQNPYVQNNSAHNPQRHVPTPNPITGRITDPYRDFQRAQQMHQLNHPERYAPIGSNARRQRLPENPYEGMHFPDPHVHPNQYQQARALPGIIASPNTRAQYPELYREVPAIPNIPLHQRPIHPGTIYPAPNQLAHQQNSGFPHQQVVLGNHFENHHGFQISDVQIQASQHFQRVQNFVNSIPPQSPYRYDPFNMDNQNRHCRTCTCSKKVSRTRGNKQNSKNDRNPYDWPEN